MNNIKRHTSYSVHFLLNNPAMTTTVLATLGLGIGAFLAVFSVVYGVLLKPLPFPEPDRLIQVSETLPGRGVLAPLREATVWELYDMSQSVEEFGAWHGAILTLTGLDVPEQLQGASVSVGFFRTLAVNPIVGRLFKPGEDQAAAEPVALISHSWWTSRFGSDPQVIRRQLMLNGRSYAVVGVLPAGTPWLDTADVFIPLVRRGDANRLSREYTAIGRLKTGMTLASANTDFSRIMRELRGRYSEYREAEIAVLSADNWGPGPRTQQMLWVLLGAVGLLLLIACVNVTNLLLARASAGMRDTAVRAALGASNVRLYGERLLESLPLSLGGGIVGYLVARAMLRMLRTYDSTAIPQLVQVGLNTWALAVSLILAVVIGVLIALAPALHFRSRFGFAALLGNPRIVGDPVRDRIQKVFVSVEVALAVVVLVGAGLLTRSLLEVLRVNRGFETEQRLLATISLPPEYEEPRRELIATALLAEVERLPGVISLAGVSSRPLDGVPTAMDIVPVTSTSESEVRLRAQWRRVTAHYFRTMGVPIITGRAFTERDLHQEPWRVIVAKRLADILWPGQDPMGKTAVLWRGQLDYRAEVIGVAGDMRERGLEEGPTPTVYLPFYGVLGRAVVGETKLDLVIHTRSRAENITGQLRSVVAGIDKMLPVSNIRTLGDVVRASVATRQLTMLLLAIFAIIALLLAVAGVCSVLSYSIACRRSQMGIRIALGAPHGLIIRRAVIEGMIPVFSGCMVGVVASYGLGRVMTSLVFGITVTDPITFISVPATILAVATSASYFTARQILSVDPAAMLRIE
jgi:putative ABC transport system permease protein